MISQYFEFCPHDLPSLPPHPVYNVEHLWTKYWGTPDSLDNSWFVTTGKTAYNAEFSPVRSASPEFLPPRIG